MKFTEPDKDLEKKIAKAQRIKFVAYLVYLVATAIGTLLAIQNHQWVELAFYAGVSVLLALRLDVLR